MQKQRITQDYIAKKLNVSRNTVSKVFNNQSGVSEETRKKVLSIANQLNYKTNIMDLDNSIANNSAFFDIAFVCHSDSLTNTFWTHIVKSTESVLNEKNANFRLVIIRNYDEEDLIIPNSLKLNPPNGIVMIGRFKSEYYELMFGLGLPIVTLDISKDIAISENKTDIVMMDDFNATYTLTDQIIKEGHTNIVFVGDKSWCYSFYGRWCGYCAAMLDNNLAIPNSINISPIRDDQIAEFTEKITEEIKTFANKPTAFVCANDIFAATIDALQYPPYNLFDTIRLSGFDNYKGLNITSPNFSTVDPNLKEIGKILAEQIIYRINNPKRKFRIIHVNSELIFNKN